MKGMRQKGDIFVSHLMGCSTAAGLIPACGSSLRFPYWHPRIRLFQGVALFPTVCPSFPDTLG